MSQADAEAEYIKLSRNLQEKLLANPAANTAAPKTKAASMKQAQSVMSNVEGAADIGDKDLAVLVEAEQYEEMKLVLTSGAQDIDAANEDGETALHIACDRGHAQGISLLLQHGANARAASNDKQTPLHMLMCASPDCVDSIDLLLKHKVRVFAA